MLQELIEQQEKVNLGVARGILEEFEDEEPIVAIINTNENDEPSRRYINSKCKWLSEYNIKPIVHFVYNDVQLVMKIQELNSDNRVLAIIVQDPFGDGITIPKQEVFDLVDKDKDVDRLRSNFYFDKDYNNLPLTACGLYKVINKLEKRKKVLFLGNGITTNRRLYLKMFDEGKFDCRIINSKTPKESVEELIKWSDIIVASSGVPEILECEGKIILSPSIIKTEDGIRSDLKEICYSKNFTHKKIGGIGKLTISELIRRVWEMYKYR